MGRRQAACRAYPSHERTSVHTHHLQLERLTADRFDGQMVGHPKHVAKALQSGVDLICAQAGEAGGHTGDIPATLLIPACVDAVRGHRSPLTGQPIYVIGAGAVYDGRGLAANLMWGAQAVWVGTRFVASEESMAPKAHKDMLLSAGWEDAVTTLIYTGRPVRIRRTPYVDEWCVHMCSHVPTLIVCADGMNMACD